MLRKRYDAAVTMFVFLRRRSVLEYYFGLRDAYRAANEPCTPGCADVLALPRKAGGRRWPSGRPR